MSSATSPTPATPTSPVGNRRRSSTASTSSSTSPPSWRRNSPSQQTLFKGLTAYKREANPDVYAQRRQSMSEARSQRPGVWGGVWERVTGRSG
ncbi:hypothetical protein Tdes44962_MAKER01428 [Teratosphaeria destructans]|uniref:Uncharacterized protein n=1 Tax=Teratosphaeria destructans TaxID=418781 RepID=A0A9W7SZ06_9PEZI|nr:hypothetical protein Tdes44962_MAKER01428 [Teratosphaeria destructans]